MNTNVVLNNISYATALEQALIEIGENGHTNKAMGFVAYIRRELQSDIDHEVDKDIDLKLIFQNFKSTEKEFRMNIGTCVNTTYQALKNIREAISPLVDQKELEGFDAACAQAIAKFT